MYFLTEKIGMITPPPQQCSKTKRLFFSLYYRVKDNAFKYAAETWVKSLRRDYALSGNDILYEKEFISEGDIKTHWSEINRISKEKRCEVWVGQIFSHASKDSDPSDDGLEFYPISSAEDGTLKQGEISNLVQLNWSKYGYLILSGCNTGTIGDRGWCPAQSFANTQKIPTIGQVGYGYFSKNWSIFEEKSPSDKNICLWAYERGKNTSSLGHVFGTHNRIKGRIFRG